MDLTAFSCPSLAAHRGAERVQLLHLVTDDRDDGVTVEHAHRTTVLAQPCSLVEW
jgi:hypothetical protein